MDERELTPEQRIVNEAYRTKLLAAQRVAAVVEEAGWKAFIEGRRLKIFHDGSTRFLIETVEGMEKKEG